MTRNFYPALLNGNKVTAEKKGHYWLIGGDSDLSGSISIMSKDKYGYCWYTLKGNRMILSDCCSEQEVSDMKEFLNNYLQQKDDADCVAKHP